MPKFYLTVDCGNTRVKSALFGNDLNLLEQSTENPKKFARSRGLSSDNAVCALSNVGPKEPDLGGICVYKVRDYFKERAFLDMPVNYSPTLGLDRLLLAYSVFPLQSSALIIDAGTFTKVDLVDKEGFQGGHILPGLELLRKTYEHGHLLKDLTPVSLSRPEQDLPGNSQAAMESGLYHSFVTPVVSLIERFTPQNIIITGGNGEALFEYLKNAKLQRSASIHFDSYLIHKGLLKFLLKAAKL